MSSHSDNRDEIKAQRHKARQQKVKQQVDAHVAAATRETGVLMVITGEEKVNPPPVLARLLGR